MDHPTRPEPPELTALRREIDHIDRQILDLMARRFGFARETLAVKARNGLLATDPRREAEVVRKAAALARELGLEPELVRDIFWRMIEVSKSAGRGTVASGARAAEGSA